MNIRKILLWTMPLLIVPSLLFTTLLQHSLAKKISTCAVSELGHIRAVAVKASLRTTFVGSYLDN